MPTRKKRYHLLSKKISRIFSEYHWEYNSDTRAFYFLNKDAEHGVTYYPQHKEILILSPIETDLNNYDYWRAVFKQKMNKKFSLDITIIF